MAIVRYTFQHQIIDYIRDALRQGTLSPGDNITEQMLVDGLGASRAPIREALQTLTNEGIIVTYPYKGRVIKSMTPQEILDNAYIVGAFEGALASRALPYHTEQDYESMKAIIQDMAQVKHAGQDLALYEEQGNAFHSLVCGFRHMPEFANYSRRLCKDVTKLLYYRLWKGIFSPEERVKRHACVLEAILSQDVQNIESALRSHHMEVGERICARLESENAG